MTGFIRWSIPIRCLDNSLAITVAMLAIAPPIANPPLIAPLNGGPFTKPGGVRQLTDVPADDAQISDRCRVFVGLNLMEISHEASDHFCIPCYRFFIGGNNAFFSSFRLVDHPVCVCQCRNLAPLAPAPPCFRSSQRARSSHEKFQSARSRHEKFQSVNELPCDASFLLRG